MDNVITKTISPHQRGGLPGRRAEDILISVKNAIRLLEDKENSGALAALDFVKAYDRVNRKVIWKIMRARGFPETFIDQLSCLYEDIHSVIQYGTKKNRTSGLQN